MYQTYPRITNVEVFTHLLKREVRQHCNSKVFLTYVRPAWNPFPAPRHHLLTYFRQFRSFDNGELQAPLASRRTSARFDRPMYQFSSVLQTLGLLKRVKEQFRSNAKACSRRKASAPWYRRTVRRIGVGHLGDPRVSPNALT